MRPLPRAVLILAAGIAAGLRLPISAIPPLLLLGACVALFFLIPKLRPRVALAAFAAVGALLGQSAAATVRADCRARLGDGTALEIAGTFTARPTPGTTVGLRLARVAVGGRTVPCGGVVRARVAGRAETAPAAGVAVKGWGRWWAIPQEGAWPRPAKWAGTLVLDSVRRAPAGPERVRHPLMAARGAALDRVRALFPTRAGLVGALILAEDGGLDPEVRDRFTGAGLAHVLSISGLHVGLIAATLLLLGRVLRVSHTVSAIAAAVVTVAYVLFLGAPYAAARAALQVVLLLTTRLTQRPADPLSLLAAAALVLLALDPLALLNAGFQLSFAGTAGLILLRRRLLDALPVRRGRVLRDGIATSIAATLATAPIAVLHFGRIAPIGILANLAGVPLVGVAVPAVALALVVGMVSLPAGRFLAGGAELLLGALDTVAGAAAAIPGGSVLVPRDAVAGWALAAVLCALITGRLARNPIRGGGNPNPLPAPGAAPGGPVPRRPPAGVRPGVRRVAGAIVVLAVLAGWPAAARHIQGDALEIHAVDVGQGDAFAIRTPAGHWILVDAGPRTESYDAGRARVVPFLLEHGARRLDALILTHPDADHIGGAAAVLEAFDVAAIMDPGVAAAKSMYLDLIREAGAEDARWIAARAGQEVRFDGVVFRFLHPIGTRLDGSSEANEVSVAFELEYGRFRALFLGDAPAEVESVLVARHGAALRSAVLKVGHHGSETSTSEALLRAVAPKIALISVGRHNRYGHPDPVVIRRLERHGVRILRTDRDGAIRLRIHLDGRMEVETSR